MNKPGAEGLRKPYINLSNEMGGGIVSLFMFDREVASRLTALGQTIMRRDRGLLVGDRELIAAFVSKLNDCHFCSDSHAACAKEFLGDSMVDEVIKHQNTEVLPIKLRALLCVAAYVQGFSWSDKDQLPECIENAKKLGASDEEIHDTVLVASFFSMCNRYVDCLGTTFKPGEPETGGQGLARYGYTMGFGRFFREVLPKLWKKWWK